MGSINDILPVKDKKAQCLKCNNIIKTDEDVINPRPDELKEYYKDSPELVDILLKQML